MPPITASAEIDRCAADVYAYTTDPSRFFEWQQGVLSGRMEPAGGDHPARCVTVRRIGFAKRASTAELVHANPPRSWRVQGIDGPIRASVDVAVTEVSEERSRVTIAVDFEGHGFGKLVVPLAVRRQARHEMPANLSRLKKQLERSSS